MKTKWLNYYLPVAVVLAVVSVVGFPGCEDSATTPEIPPAPTISGLSETTLSVGDTLVITGTDFLPEADQNVVTFNNPVGAARPFAASPTQISVVVPRHAATGPVSATVEGNPESGVGPAVEVTRAVGEVWVWEGLGPDKPLKVLAPVSSEYLIVPHATNPSRPFTEVYPYTITPNEATGLPAPPSLAGSRARVAMAPTSRERFEAHLHDQARELLDVVTLRVPIPLDGPAPAAPLQSFRNFFVLNTATGSTISPANFTEITAELKVTGTWSLIYADVDTLASGNLGLSDFQNFASVFDNTIHPNNTNFFGSEFDVDANGKVIILISPVVNRLSDENSGVFIGGFFLANDLGSPAQGVPEGTTNVAEIFYMLAADPTGVWSFPFTVPFTAEENLRTIAHEYEHLISFSQRAFSQDAVFQTTWLEEGMAHMAEDLNNMDQSNVNRVNRYFLDPGDMTLEHNQAPLAQRGAAYLFLRWLGDRFGETIYKQMVQSKCVGRACIENITGENFYVTVADWLATLYLSGRGINTSSTYNYQSLDIAADFNAFPISSHVVGGAAVNGDVLRSTGDFYLFTNTTTAVNSFVFAAPSTGRLRAVVVRTQ